MENIHVQVLLAPSSTLEGEIIAHSTYGLTGTGGSQERAKDALQSAIVEYVSRCLRQNGRIPSPQQQLRTIDEVTHYFAAHISREEIVAEDESVLAIGDQDFPVVLYLRFYKVHTADVRDQKRP